MLNAWKLVQRILMLPLLALLIGACAAMPQQTRSVAPTLPAAAPASPVADADTPVPTAQPATPMPPTATPTSTAHQDNAALTRQIYQQVKDGTPVVVIADPKLRLPDDVHPGQIKKYFQIGTVAIGLVLQRSINVVLDVPNEYTPSVTGVIVSEAGAPWRKYLEIRDAERTDKNNPYFLWAQQGQLYLSIVDQSGAGSGEGHMRLMRLAATGDWEVAGCYYFGGTYNNTSSDGDYFEFSRYLDKQKEVSASFCQTGEIVLLP